jgi:hypothetical protein
MKQSSKEVLSRCICGIAAAGALALAESEAPADGPTDVPTPAAVAIAAACDSAEEGVIEAAAATDADTFYLSMNYAHTQLQRAIDVVEWDVHAYGRVKLTKAVLSHLRAIDRPVGRLADPARTKYATAPKKASRVAKQFLNLDKYLARSMRMTPDAYSSLVAAQQVPPQQPVQPVTPPSTTPTLQSISEFKSGISLKVQGTYGLDYLVENWYHDPRIDPRCVVYLRPDTKFTFIHNAQNIVNFRPEFVTVVGPDVGTIRYRVDQEYGRRGVWTNYWGKGAFPAWPGPQSFSVMQFTPGVPVFGTTGPVPGVAPNNNTCTDGSYYWRGVKDDFNDEWHVIAVGDDDMNVPQAPAGPLHPAGGPTSAYQGDGKVYYFVVGPATPSIAIVPRDTASQYYTTPAKVYFVPKIHPQTTYVSGKCNLEIAALGAAACRYSLVPQGSDPQWQDYTGPIDLAALSQNTKYDLSYRIGQSGPIKTRVIHYAPSFPSDAETHPNDILWTGNAGLEAVKARINDPNPTTPTRHLYGEIYRGGRDNPFLNGESGPGYIPLLDGKRTRGQFGIPGTAASMPMLIEGLGKYPEKEQFLHDSLLDNSLGLDPVGDELSHDAGTPCQELMQAGGYSTGDLALGLAMAYDWHIKTFRRGLTIRGFTAVEDYKIRDTLGAFVHMTAVYMTDPYGGAIDGNGFDTGMWSTAWTIDSMVVAAVMPEYDTPYFGTSGAPKGSQPVARKWTPWMDEAHSWWEWTNSKTITPLGAPNLVKKTGIYGLINDVPEWRDRAGYLVGDYMMGHHYYLLMNFRHHYDGYHFPHLDAAMLLAATTGLSAPYQTNEGNCFLYPAVGAYVWGPAPSLVNHNFPAIAAALDPKYLAPIEGKPTMYDYWLWRHPYGLFYYEDDWASAK